MQIGSHHKRINKAPSPSSSIRHSQQHYQNHFVPHSSIAHNVQEDQYGTFTNRFYKNRMPLLTYLLSYLLTPWSTVLLEKLTAFQLVKKFPALYWTRRFIAAFTSAGHLSLSWASSIQSMPPHSISWRSILILSSYLRLGLPSGIFPSGFSAKTQYATLFSPILAICPANLILLDLFTRKTVGWEYRSLSSTDH